MAKLTREERDIVEAFERDELRPPRNKAAMMKKHREYAAATLREDRAPRPLRGRHAPDQVGQVDEPDGTPR